MLYSEKLPPSINFPRPEMADLPIRLDTFGFRANGIWLVRAQLPPRFRNAPVVLGRTALEVDLGPHCRHLEPPAVNEMALAWVEGEAATNGLRIVTFEDSTSLAQDGYHGVAAARFTLGRQQPDTQNILYNT